MVKASDTSKSLMPTPWFSIIVFIVVIFINLAIWFTVVYDLSLINMVHSLEHSIPWIILILVISLAILSAFAIWLMQLTFQRKRSYEIMSASFQKEIDERLRAEDTKQKLEKALLQGQKLQAIGTLAGGIAHDFNNILYAIIGYVEMAREDVNPESPIHKNLGKVLDASHRGQELVARILAFGRRQHHNFIPLSIKDTIEGVLSLLKPTIPASVSINLKPMPLNCTVFGNQTQLHQVIVNIINNAVDAMDGEGTITIEVDRILPNDQLLQQFSKIQTGNYCKIEISDIGHGMDQATMERIYEPFFTTKEVGKGTGLGLATVHSIMKEHLGEILVESQLGRGTKFTLLIPEYQNKGE